MIIRIFNRLEEGFIALLLVAMTLLTFMEVVLRFGFNHGFLWAEELTLHISAWMVLFGASWGVKVGAHIGVEAFVKLFSSKTQRIFGLIAASLAVVYCGLIMFGAYGYLAKLMKIGIEMEDLPVPKYLAHSILLLGMALLAVRFIQLIWQIAVGKATGFHHVDEAEEALRELESEQGAQPAAGGSQPK